MALSEWTPSGPSAVIAGSLALLILGGCGVGGELKSDDLRDVAATVGSGIEMGQKMADAQHRFEERLRERFGPEVRWQMVQGASEGILIVGLADAPEGAAADAALDGVWEDFAAAYADGAPPVSALAAGRGGEPLAGPDSLMGEVSGWTGAVVGDDDLAARTGIAPPPTLEFFTRVQEMQRRGSGIQVEVR